MIIECAGCAKTFEPRNGGKKQKYCSGACRQEVAKRNFKSRQASELSQRLEKLFCRQCGKKVNYKGVGAIPIFCADKCKQKFHNTKSRRSRGGMRPTESKNCEFCGDSFMPKKRDAKYCPDKWCGQAAYERRKALGQELPKSFDVSCDGCGIKFTAKKFDARWCSKTCANRHWGNVRARQARVREAGSYADRDVFVRDNWVCYLCGGLIDAELPRTDPMGATIDHVVPLARGGDDSLENVRAAHFSCNVRKGSSSPGL